MKFFSFSRSDSRNGRGACGSKDQAFGILSEKVGIQLTRYIRICPAMIEEKSSKARPLRGLFPNRVYNQEK